MGTPELPWALPGAPMAAINPKLATPTPSRPLPQEPFVLSPYPPLYDNPKGEAFPGKDQAGVGVCWVVAGT